MDKTKLNCNKDILKRHSFLKNEFKKIILKSVFQNFAKKKIRIDAMKRIIFFKKDNSISRQNNVCLLTGRIGGVFKNYNIARHSIKRMGKFNMLTNTKINSW